MTVDKSYVNKTGGKIDDANESVLYHNLFDGDSSHVPIDHASHSGTLFPLICPHDRIPPPWVHVFSKSNKPSSLRTQAASIAHIEQDFHKKARHRRNRRAKKKMRKQNKLLTEVILPQSFQHTLLSDSDVEKEVIVVDGGVDGNPPIRPPDGVTWRLLSVREGIQIHVQDELDPLRGLTFSRVDGVLPFARLPRKQSLDAIQNISIKELISALEVCEKLKKTPLFRSDRKRIFSDYGKRVMYTCAGVQVSRNARGVLDNNAYMDNLSDKHLGVIMKLMRHAEYCYQTLADTEVISHVYHAKQLVPFKTMTVKTTDDQYSLNYFGALAFGCNVFLQCHTDSDFTMSIANIHLKGKDKYEFDDPIVIYFCFPTLGIAVPLRPGDFIIFNALIPHCVSSRCREADEVMCISMYLKSSVVGLNDNLLPLDNKQYHLASRYNSLYKH